MRQHQFCGRQHIQVERKRRAGKTQTAGNLSRGQTFRSVPHQKPENVKACLLSQSGQRIDSIRCLHISKTMEMYDSPRTLSNRCQTQFQRFRVGGLRAESGQCDECQTENEAALEATALGADAA